MANQPTLFWYSNGEDSEYRDLLIASGVKRIQLNFGLMQNFAPTKIDHILAKLRSNGCNVLLDPSCGPITKKILARNEDHISHEDFMAMEKHVRAYRNFLEKWGSRIDFALNCDFDQVFVRPHGHGVKAQHVMDEGGTPQETRPHQVEQWDMLLVDTGVPIIKVWHPMDGNPIERCIGGGFEAIALRGIQNKSELLRYMMDARRARVTVHAIGMARPEWLEQMGFNSAVVSTWINGKVFGHTYIFEGGRISYYKAEEKATIRKRYADRFTQMGLNADKIIADDPHEVSKMNLRAWLAYEQHLHKMTVGAYIVPETRQTASHSERPTAPQAEDKSGETSRTQPLNPETSAVIEMLQDMKGSASTEDAEIVPPFSSPQEGSSLPSVRPVEAPVEYQPPQVPSRKSQALQGNQNAAKAMPTKKKNAYIDGFPLQCNTCFAANRCPKFQENALCAFREEFTDLSTRDFESAMTELENLAVAQKERTALALLFEKVMGGGLPDKTTDRQIDRQLRILDTIGKLRKEQSMVSVQISPTGIFAQLFGPGIVDPDRLPEAIPEGEGEIIEVEAEDA